MTMTDPLGDMLTRIRNAQLRSKSMVSTPASKLRRRVLDVLEEEGYIRGYATVDYESGRSSRERQFIAPVDPQGDGEFRREPGSDQVSGYRRASHTTENDSVQFRRLRLDCGSDHHTGFEVEVEVHMDRQNRLFVKTSYSGRIVKNLGHWISLGILRWTEAP